MYYCHDVHHNSHVNIITYALHYDPNIFSNKSLHIFQQHDSAASAAFLRLSAVKFRALFLLLAQRCAVPLFSPDFLGSKVRILNLRMEKKWWMVDDGFGGFGILDYSWWLPNQLTKMSQIGSLPQGSG